MRGGKFMMNGKGIWSKLGPIEIQKPTVSEGYRRLYG